MNQENLWAPWRMAYVRELGRRAGLTGVTGAATAGSAGESTEAGDNTSADAAVTFLSTYWREPENDVVNHVIHRDDQGMILLNRYPYANGHLLVALGDPRPTLLDYDPAQRAALWSLVEFGMELMSRAINPQGVNIGINQGKAAGAGIPEHLHAHLVPRWGADTNFITVVGQLRVIPDSLEAMAAEYRKARDQLGGAGR